MKSLKIATVITGLFFMQQFVAQGQAISTQYSNEEIAQMLKAYKTSYSQDVVPPVALQQKLQTDFPHARDIEWETDGHVYEAEFEVKFRDYEAYYDDKSNLLMVVREIYASELPLVVRNAAESKYPKYHFEDMDKIQRGSEVFYKIEMERGEIEIKLLVKSDGTIIV
ncbi:MAG: PepSY-like domain-containing protein [Dysgonamonadaceae bacterium]|jgi:hypothetical protein|nr:PepSY-like domain-containing protein [Dysgonamonadaceae bacterium]